MVFPDHARLVGSSNFLSEAVQISCWQLKFNELFYKGHVRIEYLPCKGRLIHRP